MLLLTACTSLPTTYTLKEKQYIDQITRKIEIIGESRYPDLATHVIEPCEAQLAFQITHGGTLMNVTLLKACGNHVIDNAMLELIRYAAPYPPMPDDITRSTLKIIKRWTFMPAR